MFHRIDYMTSDYIFTLRAIIENSFLNNQSPLFLCFVDFKKAFDSIPRHVLFQKLLDYNINGKFYDCLVNIYINDIACVKVGEHVTPSFLANQGVKQGCILSPTLFNIFLADFQPLIETNPCDPVMLRGNLSIGCLIWADDILLLSKSKEGLQAMLQALYLYAEKNGMALNTKKTKIMIFNKTGRHIRRDFYFGHDKLTSTREYKYLGFLITPSGEINSGLNDLKDRAQRAFFKLKKKMGSTFRTQPSLTIKLFRSLIEPILLYASDLWGVMKLPASNPIENLFMSFCKQLLGVQKQTTNFGVLLELGLIPLTIWGKKKAIKNWVRIAEGENCSEILKESYAFAVEENLSWPENVKNLASQIGLRQSFIDMDIDLHLQSFQRLSDIFHQQAFADIKRVDSKLRTYSRFKLEPGFENYLDEIHVKERTALTKLRLSNHLLMIEKGRHLNISRDQRFCPFCPNIIENEKHFLTRCPQYRHLREELFNQVKTVIPQIHNRCDDQKFLNLMSSFPNHVARFSLKAMELREFLSERPRVSD